MLRALELVGFKSFADRTRFDFPEGITAVVGPNGSGKSNVVDAIKWVLGAHSARAIRGAEMTDVIFKGSAEGGRKPANSAEVVLVLDNRTRTVSRDADEVQICRRVYRSGESEYAINGQPCRLKDVRDLFRGTGVGVDSYSLIEQGKVDRLLQSSAKERRGIFEEAAGISRFKAKKAEAERRLARVDQNMLRIRDMVDELGRRLSTLKQQASKAQRYREWTQQLFNTRTRLGLLDLQEVELQNQSVEKRVGETTSAQTEVRALSAHLQEQFDQEQLALNRIVEELNTFASSLSKSQAEHTQASQECQLIQHRTQEWENERGTLLERIELLERRVSIGEEEILERKQVLQQNESECEQASRRTLALETEVRTCEEGLSHIRRQRDEAQQQQDSLRQQIARIQVDASSQFKALESTETELLRIEQQIADKSAGIDKLTRDAQDLQQELDSARADYQASETAKEAAKRQLDEIVDRARKQQQICLELHTRIQGLQERFHLLAELEDQFANAGRGGQQLMRSALEFAKSNPLFEPSGSSICGIVADLIQSDLHLAPLVDVALGVYADALVLRDGQVIDWIQGGRLIPEGRVTLLRLDRLPTRRTGERIQLDGLRGVLGRADRLVRFDSANEPLVRALLGTTWFVESLATALELSSFRGAGLRFVTAECQLIDNDGSITIGSLQSGLGLVSRRSEMQATIEQRDSMHASLADAKTTLETIEEIQRSAIQRVQQTDLEVVACARRVAGIEQKLHSCREQRESEQQSLEILNTESIAKTDHRDQIDQFLIRLDRDRIKLEHLESIHTANLDQLAQQIQDREIEHRQVQQRLIEHRIESARQEQRLDGLRLTLDQLLHDASERTNHLQTARDQLHHIEERISETHARHELLSNRLRELDSERAILEQNRDSREAERESYALRVSELSKQKDQYMRQLDKIDDRLAALTEEIGRIAQHRNEIVSRYLGEYQIDLLNPEAQNSHTDPSQRPEIEADLFRLRQEIAAAGSVNMEALEELDELQKRYDRLASQEQDLLDARDGLLKTMHKIDEDARTLFHETLEAIRTNFQQLYRKSFGGGSADIILENPEDPESGIEIVATPPGKTTFSNSLLSGGEKALTAVSLIMAFFQYRPSPFCILDEVDAPFDEANIGRFVAVLDEFLDSTKFIIVTHSKKTMNVANMIYGVTMQESGVSRQVAVKFEEVDDRGEIVRRAA
jgi:chromosome segregation protein